MFRRNLSTRSLAKVRQGISHAPREAAPACHGGHNRGRRVRIEAGSTPSKRHDSTATTLRRNGARSIEGRGACGEELPLHPARSSHPCHRHRAQKVSGDPLEGCALLAELRLDAAASPHLEVPPGRRQLRVGGKTSMPRSGSRTPSSCAPSRIVARLRSQASDSQIAPSSPRMNTRPFAR